MEFIAGVIVLIIIHILFPELDDEPSQAVMFYIEQHSNGSHNEGCTHVCDDWGIE